MASSRVDLHGRLGWKSQQRWVGIEKRIGVIPFGKVSDYLLALTSNSIDRTKKYISLTILLFQFLVELLNFFEIEIKDTFCCPCMTQLLLHNYLFILQQKKY